MKILIKKSLAILVAFAVVISMLPGLPLDTYAAGLSFDGSGTKDSPYLVKDAADLVAMQESGEAYAGKYFKVTDNIEVSSDLEFTGIGTSSDAFKGNFDGDGKTITLAISAQNKNNVGLFGYIGSGAVIHDVTVAGEVAGAYSVGGIAGFNYGGTVTGCSNEAVIKTDAPTSSEYGAGGIIGTMAGGNVESCTNSGAIVAGYESETGLSKINFGGIVGIILNANANSTISDCHNSGNMTAIPSTAGVAGIVGKVLRANTVIEDCTNSGNIEATGTASNSSGGAAGITGYISGAGSSVERCANSGQVTGRDQSSAYTGGIVGRTNSQCTISQSYNKGTVTASNGYVGGIAGYLAASVTAVSCYNAGEVNNTKTAASTSSYYPSVAAGIAAQLGGSTASVKNCYSYGEIINSSTGTYAYAAGIIGKAYSTTVNAEIISGNTYLTGRADIGIGNISSDAEGYDDSENATDILGKIGNDYQADLTPAVNGGYPILRWQNSEALYKLAFAVTDAETNAKLKENVNITVKNSENSKQTANDDGSYELAPGTYSYTVSRAGYTPVSDEIVIKKASKTADIKLTSIKHQFKITVSPADAVLNVTNEEAPAIGAPEKTEAEGKTVYTYSLADEAAYGSYSYTLSRYGYNKASGTLSATGENDEAAITMVAAAKNKFEITVSPKNAKVTLINAEYGVTVAADSEADGVWTYSLIPGEYSYKVKASGYTTKAGAVTMDSAEDKVAVSLEQKLTWDGTSTDTDWYEDDKDAFDISEPEELAGLAELVNEGTDFEGKTINLIKDIDLGGDSENNKNHWTSIGNNSKKFKGAFNGNGHKIKNLYINMTGTSSAANGYRGLFGQTENAYISDFTLEGVDITTSTKTGYQNVGAVVGYGKATDIRNIVTSGHINNNDSASYNGGIAGKFSGTIIDCVNNIDITAGYQVGGIVGTTYDNNGTQILRCVNNGTITANSASTTKSYASGGIVGCLYKTDDIVRYCINNGIVTGGNQSLGGIVGATNTGSYKTQKIVECYNMGAITATKDSSYVGGIVGYVITTNNPYINNCYSAGELTGSNNIGGVIGSQSNNSINSELIYNNYYKSNDNYKGSRYGTGATTTALEHEAFEAFETMPAADDLGSAYGADVKDGETYKYNKGFPILRWQNPDSVYDIKFVPEYDEEYNLDDDNQVKISIKDKNDQDMPVTGTVAQLPNGEYLYTVERKGYETVTGNITVDRESFEETVKLTATKYNYVVTIEEGADFDLVMVTDDGDTAITRPEYKDGKYTYQLYNGTYNYTANKLGKGNLSGQVKINFADAEETISFEAKDTASVSFKITPATGSSFAGDDPVVSVYNNDTGDYYQGTLMGEYDSNSEIAKGIKFPVGSYTYKIKAEGFKTETGELTVAKDKPVTITKQLKVKTGWSGAEDVDTDWYTNNKDASEYTLTNESQLAGLAKLVNDGTETFANKTVKLARDMDLSDNAWTPIGGYSMQGAKAFSGTFDGDGHTITFANGEIKNSETTFGVFGYIKKATIKNLVLQGRAEATYTEEAARFVLAYVGALAGYAEASEIKNCSNQMTFEVSISNEAGTASVNMGGLVGWSVGTSYECCNNIAKVTGSVTGSGNTTCYAGGISGFNNSGSKTSASTTSNCYNTGEVSAKAVNTGGSSTCYAGGLFGTLSSAYFTMSNCYNAANIQVYEAGNQKAGALVGNKSGTGSFTNNYYLENGLDEPTANSIKKTEAEMKDSGFAEALGDAYRANANGGYPILDWEGLVDHIVVTTQPAKTKYDDLSDFDDTGMEITAYMGKDNTDGKVVTSGWTIKDGKSLQATQKKVTIEYKGATTEVGITVNQVVHLIDNDELVFDITAPQAGETPQTTLNSGSNKFNAAISWTKGGEAFTDEFEAGTYYRAEIELNSTYEKDNVYWAFDKNSMPAVDSAYEIKNISFEQTTDENKANNVMTFTVTFRATSSASGLTDKVSHLYYEGDNSTFVRFGDYLDKHLAIEGGITKIYTVRELEQLVLDKAVGIEGKFGEYELAGIRLYDLLLESGLSQNTADDTKVYIYGKAKKPVETTIGELRSNASDKPAVIAYGDIANGMPLGSAYGPLRIVQQDISGIWCSNVSRIVIGNIKEADRYNVIFDVKHTDDTDATAAEVVVRDSYSNIVTPGEDGKYSLRNGETYSYTVSETGYGVETGEITVKEDTTITVSLRPSWDGKTLTEPAKDEDGYYLIGTADELMWWHEHYKETDKVKLTADITLNNGKDNSNVWEVLGTNSGYGTSKTLAFQGHFDGQGHVIRGLYINRENELEFEVAWDGSVMEFSDRISEIGMFGYTGGNAVIENLGVEGVIEILDRPDSMYADWMQVGGLVGLAQGYTQIKNCYTNVGIKCIASTETATVGGCPLSGWGDKCDTYIGGIAGSISANTAISDCYSKGTLIGAETRQVTIGGIVGGIRSAETKVTNCYSTASIQSLPLENTTWNSYVGGIAGQGAWSGKAGSIKGSVALNRSINGNNTRMITAARVVGNASADRLDGNFGLSSMMFNGVNIDNTDRLNGKLIKLDEAMDASTYSAWDSENTWKLGGYPQLKWQTAPAGDDIIVSYEGQTYEEDDEWDGFFGSAAAPAYFKVNFKVDGYDSVLAKKFTREQMMQMAQDDNEGTLYYSAVAYGYAGRAVKEYVYLDALLQNAGVTFEKGDKLAYGTYYEYPYEYLMADRYYYPEWTSGSDANAVKIKPVIALKSFGASSGVTKELWNYYALQADYLYAYMLTFGQKTPDEDTYGYFTYQQVEGTVVYDDEAPANSTVKSWLESVISQAEADYDATYESANGADVPGGCKYVSPENKAAYLAKINETKAALAAADATNGSLMEAGEALEKTIKAFDKVKKGGLGKDRTKLDSAIKLAQKILEETVVSEDGSELHEGTLWTTADKKTELENAVKKAQTVYDDADASQSEIDSAAFDLTSRLGEFTTEAGRIEQAVREESEAMLREYVEDYIDRDKYRDKELAEIDRILEEAIKNIGEAKTVNTIKFALDDAMNAIKEVKTALDAQKSDAQAELDEYFYSIVDSYDAAQKVVLREALTESKEKISAAKDIPEVLALITSGKAAMDKIDKKSQQGGGMLPQQPEQKTDEAAKALETAKNNALDVLQSWYAKNDQYYDEQKSELSNAVLEGVKEVKAAKDIAGVSKALENVVEKIKTIKTKEQIDAEKAISEELIKQKKATAVLQVKALKVTTKTVKTAKGHIKITANADLSELKEAGFTVRYKFYRSTKKTSGYKLMKTKSVNSYTNTSGKKGKRYYYKTRVAVYYNDELVAQTTLKQSTRGSRKK